MGRQEWSSHYLRTAALHSTHWSSATLQSLVLTLQTRTRMLRPGMQAVAACLVLLIAITGAPAAANYNAVKNTFKTSQAVFKPMFVLIGDSITEYGFEAPHGWALQLASRYSRRADVINRGFGGRSQTVATT